MYKYWFLWLVPQRGTHALALGLVVWAAVAFAFVFGLGYLGDTFAVARASALGTGLFFASVNVFSVFMGAWVVRRSVALLDDLDLDCSAAERAVFIERLTHLNRRQAVLALVVSLGAGITHATLLQEQGAAVVGLFGSIEALTGWLGTVLTWFVVTNLVWAFINNARVFADIGRRSLRLALLQPARHALFGRAAVMPTLGLIGTQVMYPLLGIGGNFSAFVVLPGFLVTLFALVFLFVQTLWPVHARLRALRDTSLRAVDDRVGEVLGGAVEPEPEQLQRLNPLLTYRSHLQQAPVWPLSMTLIARWSIYLLIPPLTWVGAALIEILVDSAIM